MRWVCPHKHHKHLLVSKDLQYAWTPSIVDARGSAYSTWSAILSAPAQRRAGAAPRRAASIWAAPLLLTLQQQAEARQRRAEGATLKDLARSYNVSMATISRLRT